MKLTDTASFQDDEMQIYGSPTIDISFTMRSREENELVHREFEFTRGLSDEWTIHHYTEKRTKDTERVMERNWRTCEDIHWNDMPSSDIDIDIPQSVIEELDAMLDMDVLKLR